jgi:LacI family transcriptional regulator, galactose operon repressor
MDMPGAIGRAGTPAKARQRSTIIDVARHAGVSPATVSRALSHPEIVHRETLERVRSAVSDLAYVRDGTGRALVSGRTHTVGIVVPTLSHSIFAVAIDAMQTTLADAGYQLIVASHEYDPATEVDAVRALVERGVDALLLVGTDHARGLWRILDSVTIPVVLTWSLHKRIGSVGFDNAKAGRLAAEYLLSLGHRRFALISGHLSHNDRARARLKGVRSALEDAGIEPSTLRVVEESFGLAGGRSAMSELLARRSQPTAVIGGNDLMAIGGMFEAQSRRLEVPRDISFVGIDDLELSAHVMPGLTSVHLPTSMLGKVAAEQVLRRLADEEHSQRVELPIRLVARASTGHAPD